MRQLSEPTVIPGGRLRYRSGKLLHTGRELLIDCENCFQGLPLQAVLVDCETRPSPEQFVDTSDDWVVDFENMFIQGEFWRYPVYKIYGWPLPKGWGMVVISGHFDDESSELEL